jgi:hypothetical protein
MMEILTSRSRYQDWVRCNRARFWLHEWRGTGLEPVRVALPLAAGTSIHAGLAALLKAPSDLDGAVKVAISDYEAKCSGRGLDIDLLESQSFVFAEQKALVEALVRMAGMRVVPRLLEMYEVLEVETMDRRPLWRDEWDGSGETMEIIWRSIPDALLRSRDDGQLYLLSWKTCSQLPKDSDARVDVQGVSEAWGIGGRLEARWLELQASMTTQETSLTALDRVLLQLPTEPQIRGVQMAYLVKGQRREAGKDATQHVLEGAAGKVYKTASPLIYGYQDKSFPPKLAHATMWQCSSPHPMRKSQWYPSGECPGDGRNHKRGDEWQSFPVWETLGVKDWLEMLDRGEVTPEAGDILDAQWALPVPMYRTQDQLERWFRQAQTVEKRIASDLGMLREFEGALAENPDDLDLLDTFLERLDRSVFGPMSTDQCEHWFGRRCPMVPVCHGTQDAVVDPVGTGLFQIKTQYVERVVEE